MANFNVIFSGITKLLCRIDLGTFVINSFEVTATPATISKFLSLTTLAKSGSVCHRLTLGKGIKLVYELTDGASIIKMCSAEWYAYLDHIKMRSLLTRMSAHVSGLESTDTVDPVVTDGEDSDDEPEKENDFLNKVDELFADVHANSTDFVFRWGVCCDNCGINVLAPKVNVAHYVYYTKTDVENFEKTCRLQVTYVGKKYDVLESMFRSSPIWNDIDILLKVKKDDMATFDLYPLMPKVA